MRFRLSRFAQGDVRAALRQSATLFGIAQAERYSQLIAKTIGMAALDPEHARSRPRPELGSDVRSLHLEAAAGRRGAASHDVIYVVLNEANDEPELVVLRVPHDAMEPSRRVAAAVREELTPPSRPRRPRSPGR